MKKLSLVLAGILTVSAVLTGCGNEGAKNTVKEGNGAEDSGRTELKVGFDASFPPYGYMDDDGEYTGFDLELAEEVCARKGWKLVKQPIDWDAKDMELSSGSIDCIWNGFTINGREDQYTWSVPYVDNSQVFVVPAGGVSSKEELQGKVVGVQNDSSALHTLEDKEAELMASFSELVQYPEYNTAFMDLEAGAIDALAIDIGVARYQISSRGDQFVIMEEELATEQYGIGFLLGNEELKNEVEAVLLEMAGDGAFMKLAEKYGLQDSVCLLKE